MPPLPRKAFRQAQMTKWQSPIHSTPHDDGVFILKPEKALCDKMSYLWNNFPTGESRQTIVKVSYNSHARELLLNKKSYLCMMQNP